MFDGTYNSYYRYSCRLFIYLARFHNNTECTVMHVFCLSYNNYIITCSYSCMYSVVRPGLTASKDYGLGIEIQSSLRTKDTLGTGILSSFRRLAIV